MDNDFKQNQALMLVATLGASFATITAATPGAFAQTVPATDQSAISEDQVREMARNAYIYAYPLILMEMTRPGQYQCRGPSPVRSRANEPVCKSAGIS